MFAALVRATCVCTALNATMPEFPASPWLRFDFQPDVADTELPPGPLFFAHPEQIIVAWEVEEVLPALEEVQEAVNAGFYAAGYVGYEAAPAFDTAMRVRSAAIATEFPLLWFGIFARPQAPTETESNVTPEVLPSNDGKDESGEADGSRYGEWQPAISRTEYDRNIAAIREAIGRGETYQVNYTLRLRTQLRGDDYGLYTRLLRAQNGRYGAYLNIGRYHILSASPELFFHRQGGGITTRPMKGTVARGRWQEEDQEQAQALARSEKNCAENIMIVDLLRNDLGRLAVPGSVQVSDLFRLERYPTVWQMTSTVRAEIPPATTLRDIFTALFPCGSVTGAPKIETMRHIADLEDAPRHVYCGAIGLIAPNGTATFNVAIRTLLVDTETETAEYGVGGGITWDSAAGDEYAELLAKAAILQTETPAFELLETLRLENGNIRLREAHLRRLRDSAAYFGFPDAGKAAKKALYQVARRHIRGIWRVRLRVSISGEVTTEAFPLEPTREEALPVVLAESAVDSANRFLYHKTTHREVYAAHRRVMEKRGADIYDVLLWNEREELTEFTTGNLVMRLDGNFWTPPRDCGLLAGVARAGSLREGVIHERVLTRDDLSRAEGIWLINSVRGWLAVQFVSNGE